MSREERLAELRQRTEDALALFEQLAFDCVLSIYPHSAYMDHLKEQEFISRVVEYLKNLLSGPPLNE